MFTHPKLVLNLARLPAGFRATREDALAAATVECQRRGGDAAGSECEHCPELVFWTPASRPGWLKVFCRRAGER
jgi:hypothetical protein